MSKSNPIRAFFTGNLFLKLLSLTIAFSLYMAISSQPVTEVGLVVPLEYRNIPNNLEITSTQAPEVHVRVRGPADLVRRASQTDVAAFIDLDGATAGSHIYDLDHGAVHAPYGLDIVDLYPSQFRLRLEPRASRLVPIAVRLVGSPASGFEVDGYSVTPTSVRIIGPQSRVRELASVVTEPVDISGLSRVTSLTSHVYVPDPQVRLISSNTIQVTVEIVRIPPRPITLAPPLPQLSPNPSQPAKKQPRTRH